MLLAWIDDGCLMCAQKDWGLGPSRAGTRMSPDFSPSCHRDPVRRQSGRLTVGWRRPGEGSHGQGRGRPPQLSADRVGFEPAAESGRSWVSSWPRRAADVGREGEGEKERKCEKTATRRLPFLHDEVIHLDESVLSNGKCNASSTMPIQ